MKIRERENYSSFHDSIQSQFQRDRRKKERNGMKQVNEEQDTGCLLPVVT